MSQQPITITVYGREQICASCIGAPGSRDTYAWLQAAIGRRYSNENIQYIYIDIDKSIRTKADERVITRMKEEDMLYPTVFVNGDIVAEGNPRLKTIYKSLEKYGITA